jgi:two-component system phosphate regulon sensor histidine kinase PhoR
VRSLVVFTSAVLAGAALAAAAHAAGAAWWGTGLAGAIGGAGLAGAAALRRTLKRAAVAADMARRVAAAADGGVPVSFGGDDELAPLQRTLNEAFKTITVQLADLQRDRARLEAILAGMIEGVLVVDADGDVDMVNEAARHLLRLHPNPLGRPYVELIRHPEIAGQLARALDGEMAPGVEFSLSNDPAQVFVSRGAPVVTAGERGAVLVLHDITDLRRADRMRRDFVANVSHELRTPLTAIRGYVEALIDAPPAPEEAARFLAVVARHAQRMESLVKDLLRLARLDAGQETIDRAACSVEQVFAGVLGELGPALRAREQQVQVSIAPEATTVAGDPAKLHDVFRNLVENASNYSPERSAITLEAGVAGDMVELRVLDEGPGVPVAEQQRIFERFYRVDKARSRETGGTGLGLSIVKHLVELHRGEVQVGNRSPRGAVFTVRLPRAWAAVPAGPGAVQ